MAVKITTKTLEAMASSGNTLAQLCLKQREQLTNLGLKIELQHSDVLERQLRDLQRENDKLRIENARLRSNG